MNNKTENQEQELKPIHERRQSFYKKAMIETHDGKTILYSYNTKVCYIENGKAFIIGLYSQTTTRHIKEFLKQNGFVVEDTKQLIKDYGVKNEN